MSDPSVLPFPSSFRRTRPVETTHPAGPGLCWSRSWSQPVDQPQDLLERFFRHRDLGHLEDGVAGVVHDLGTDLHELLPPAGQRLLRDRLRQGQRPHEVGEIVGQRVQLKTHGIGGERAA
jgi:hypothetical protein